MERLQQQCGRDEIQYSTVRSCGRDRDKVWGGQIRPDETRQGPASYRLREAWTKPAVEKQKRLRYLGRGGIIVC